MSSETQGFVRGMLASLMAGCIVWWLQNRFQTVSGISMQAVTKGNQVILTAENDIDDQMIDDIYNAGDIAALGETPRGRRQLVLSRTIPRARTSSEVVSPPTQYIPEASRLV